MNTKQDWDSKIRFLSKMIGFDDKDANQHRQISRSQGEITNTTISRTIPRVLTLNRKLNTQIHNHNKAWDQLIKFSAKYCRKNVLSLLMDGISPTNKTWAWLLQNNQKITPKLYNIRRKQFQLIIQQNNTHLISNAHLIALTNLNQLKNHSGLASVIGAFLTHRKDITYGTTLFNIMASCYYYTQSNQIITFQIASHICVSQVFLSFLFKDPLKIQQIIQYIVDRIQKCSPSILSINSYKHLKVQLFVYSWIEGFFFAICENSSSIKPKVLAYLILQNFSKKSVSRVCQATIIAIQPSLNKASIQKYIEVLNNPKMHIDQNIFTDYLLR